MRVSLGQRARVPRGIGRPRWPPVRDLPRTTVVMSSPPPCAIIHAWACALPRSAPNTPRNFVFRSMTFAEAVARCAAPVCAAVDGDGSGDGDGGGDVDGSGGGGGSGGKATTARGASDVAPSLPPIISAGERYYLRSIGSDPRSASPTARRGCRPDLGAISAWNQPAAHGPCTPPMPTQARRCRFLVALPDTRARVHAAADRNRCAGRVLGEFLGEFLGGSRDRVGVCVGVSLFCAAPRI